MTTDQRGSPASGHFGAARWAFPWIGAAFVLLCCCLAVSVSATDSPKDEKKKLKPYALIFGTVWGADQRPVSGVKVRIRRADQKKARWELMSDSRGEFAQRVPAENADYIVWAQIEGHKGPAAEKKVHIDFDERADINLHLTE